MGRVVTGQSPQQPHPRPWGVIVQWEPKHFFGGTKHPTASVPHLSPPGCSRVTSPVLSGPSRSEELQFSLSRCFFVVCFQLVLSFLIPLEITQGRVVPGAWPPTPSLYVLLRLPLWALVVPL